MKKYLVLGLAALAPALALVMSGCSGGSTKDKGGTTVNVNKDGTTSGDKKGGETGGATSTGGKKEALEAKYDATIKGRVVFAGTPPPPQPQAAIDKHADKDYCHMAPKDQQVEQTWLIGKDNGVANVVVYLAPPAGKTFTVGDEVKAEFKKSPAVLDQPYCEFVPHVVALYAPGQQLLVKNSAKVSHNTKIQGDTLKNPASNFTLKPGEEREPMSLKVQREPLNVQCDIHSWMTAKILTFDNPYFAVTDKDGNFEIKNAPSGVPLTVEMWHEASGKQKVEGQKTLKAGENMENLQIKGK